MRSRITALCFSGVVACFALPAKAVIPVSVELRFSETQMPLGTADTVVNLLGGEYSSFGIDVLHAYRYADSRDPFSDGVENLSGWPFGISQSTTSSSARVNFLSPVSNLEIDWWVISGTMFFDIFDTSGSKIHSFSGSSIGGSTEVVPLANIAYLEFHDSGGYVQISNLRFEVVPEPTTISLLALGSLAVVIARRRS